MRSNLCQRGKDECVVICVREEERSVKKSVSERKRRVRSNLCQRERDVCEVICVRDEETFAK